MPNYNPLNRPNNIALIIEYDGSNYYGFQKQINGPSVQDQIEKALSVFCDEKIQVFAAGRTDTKVHALYQVLNFYTGAKREIHSYVKAVNALLPRDVVVRDAKVVDGDFHARFSAVSRTYHYYLYLNPVRSAILKNKVGFCHDSDLDLSLVKEGLKCLEGEHDFSCFRASDCQAKTPVRNMLYCGLEVHGNLIHFKFKANAFLYHMIRNIVGALVYLGTKKISLDEFKLLLEQKDRKIAPPTFMPEGLYLTNVEYPQKIFDYTVSQLLF